MLSFQWTCTLASLVNSGAECRLFSGVATNNSVLRVPAFVMTLNSTYSFKLLVSTLNGRSSSQATSVYPAPDGSPETFITNTLNRFNPGAKLIILGRMSANDEVTCSWSVRTNLGASVPIKTLTPSTKKFSSLDAKSQASFPVSIGSEQFVGGRSYTFRLDASVVGSPVLRTFSEITLRANPAPWGGYVLSDPPSGKALSTTFFISTPGWMAAADSLPLSYSFDFQISPTALLLSLASMSPRSYTSSYLPAGREYLNYSIVIVATAMDIYLTSDAAVSAATVMPSAGLNISQILAVQLSTAYAANNIDKVFQTVNLVSSSSSYDRNFFRQYRHFGTAVQYDDRVHWP